MEERFSSQPAGFLLSKIGLIILFGCLAIAAWNGQIVIVIVLGLLLATAGFSRLWSRLSLLGVSCQRLLSEQRVFPGERIELKLQLSNRKLLPMPWVQVDDEIPLVFTPNILSTDENRPGYGFLSKNASLLWYSKVSWKTELHCPKRGYFKLGPAKITAADIFGFYPRSIEGVPRDYVMVYPKIFPVDLRNIPSLYPLGESVAEKRIFDDPTRLMGVREYNPRDSIRRIHWKATARQQSLQVKVFEPTTTLDVAIFLVVDSFIHNGTTDDYELAISTAASIAKHIIDKGNPVGLFANTRMADSGQAVRIMPGSTPFQLVAILEALAKTTRVSVAPFQEFFRAERRILPWGTTLIFITYDVPEPLRIIFTNLKESGYKLLVYQIGKQNVVESIDNIAGEGKLAVH
jgi:uncharacterized protein (DUF58 family)